MQIKGAAYLVDLSRPEATVKNGEAAGASTAVGAAGRLRAPDRVELSSSGLELEKLKQDLSALPDVRLERVALARQNLQAGGYQSTSGAVAQKMLRVKE